MARKAICWRDHQQLAFFQPTEPFSLALRVALFGGFIIASPIIIYQVWRFIGPALTKRERRYVYPLSGVMSLLFLSGVALGYYTLPLALRVLFSFGGDLLQETVGVNFYFSFAMRFLLAFGLAFQFPVFLFAAAALGLSPAVPCASSGDGPWFLWLLPRP